MGTSGSGSENRPRRATIADVAEAAGVSNYVVNDAFTRPERMSPERVDMIRAAAARVGYTRRSYTKRRAGTTYGFLKARMEDGAADYHEWFSTTDVALHEAAHRADATMLSFSYDPESDGDDGDAGTPEVRALRDFCRRPDVGGVIITDARPAGIDPRLSWLEEAQVPFVLLGRGDDSCSWLDLDNELAAEQLTGALVDAGHRRIAHLAFRLDQTGPPAQRRAGYERIMRRGLLTAAEIERLTVEVDYGDERPAGEVLDQDARLRAVGERLVAMAEDESVTAIFCDSDLLAVTAQAVLLQHFRSLDRLPEVAGMDNSQIRRRSFRPFASAGPNWRRYGDRAVEMLRAQQADPTRKDADVLPYEIVGSVRGPELQRRD